MGNAEIIAVIGLCLTIISFFVGRVSAGKNDGKTEGMILSELGYLKSNTDDIKRRLDEQEKRYTKLSTDVEILKQEIKTIFHQINHYHSRGERDEGN